MDSVGSISGGSPTGSIAPSQGVESKRLALQAMLMKKAVEAQRQQSQQVANTFEGKGQVIDVRV